MSRVLWPLASTPLAPHDAPIAIAEHELGIANQLAQKGLTRAGVCLHKQHPPHDLRVTPIESAHVIDRWSLVVQLSFELRP